MYQLRNHDDIDYDHGEQELPPFCLFCGSVLMATMVEVRRYIVEPLVSIIVPVYNSIEYIGCCLDSILNQEYRNVELILVDDGSSDGTAGLLDEYAQKDERICVIHQENAGVSASRNHGLDIAHGKYIQFADSDDWITPDSTKLLIRTAEEKACDLVIADFYRVNGKRLSQKGDIDADHRMDRKEFASYMIENPADYYYGVLWNKLFRRSIIEEHHIRMDEEINWCEDFLFNLEYIRYAESFFAVQAPVYYYMKRKGSLVTQGISITNTIKMKTTVFDYYNSFYRDLYEEDYSEVKQKVRLFLISTAMDGIVMPTLVPGSSKLGEERVKLAGQAVSEEDGVLTNLYYFRKLLEYYVGLGATMKKITLDEALLLLLFETIRQFESRKEIAELAGLTLQKTTRAMQRLKKEKLIEYEADTEDGITIEVLDKAEEYMEELSHSVEECRRACMQDFSEQDVERIQELTEKMNENMREKLKKISYTAETAPEGTTPRGTKAYEIKKRGR
ncbi:MAG: glycosyltransferase [Lachnospiraceae bacterium]|nr:glycosyltransferase [Lachnospiraceae bacterium]